MFNTSKFLLQRINLNQFKNQNYNKLTNFTIFGNNNRNYSSSGGNNNGYEYQKNKYSFSNNRNKLFLLPTATMLIASTTIATASIVSCDNENIKTITIPEADYREPPVVPSATASKIQQVAGVTTMGGVLGYCAGIATRKIGTFVLFIVGSIFIVVQILQSKGYIVVRWDKVSEKHSPKFTKEKRRKYLRSFYNMLTSNLPFKVGFGSGFLLGFKQQ